MPLVGVELFEDEHTVKAAGDALLGQWYVNADQAAPKFIALYQATYEEYPGWATANSFDAVNLINQAFTAEAGDPLKMAKHLTELKDFAGAAGVYSATGDNRFTLPAAVKIVQEGGFKKLY
ncbi:MAG: hypothetical protein R3A13_04615 [Bdellovibrionota bacterium]